ncbi:MAG: hypothetical protein IBX69_03400 [Anaerolineales bacterium]|nr:hypothetical protein [Anaerolineales bacterium]
MDTKLIDNISQQVFRRFPDVTGSKPKVRLQTKPGGASSSKTYLLTFTGKAVTPNGKSIPRYVRVIADENGKILKMSTSR